MLASSQSNASHCVLYDQFIPPFTRVCPQSCGRGLDLRGIMGCTKAWLATCGFRCWSRSSLIVAINANAFQSIAVRRKTSATPAGSTTVFLASHQLQARPDLVDREVP